MFVVCLAMAGINPQNKEIWALSCAVWAFAFIIRDEKRNNHDRTNP